VDRLHSDLERETNVSLAELLLGRSISLEGHGEAWVLAGGAQERSQPGALSAASFDLRHCQA